MWGATCCQCCHCRCGLLFQFTLPCGERQYLLSQTYSTSDFNSRSRVGSDFSDNSCGYNRILFQFTLPCGERLYFHCMSFQVFLFQFTLPCGERQETLIAVFFIKIFQFTLPCGERPRINVRQCQLHIFQFTLPCGERLEEFKNKGGKSNYFNSRSRVGSDFQCFQ